MTLTFALAVIVAASSSPAARPSSGHLQDPPPRSGSRDVEAVLAAAQNRLDVVLGIAGSELVQQRDLRVILMRSSFKERLERARANEREYNAVLAEALYVRLQDLVMVQAGRTLGFDPVLVDEFTQYRFDEIVEGQGGPRSLSDLLRKEGLTPENLEGQIRDQLLAEAWRSGVSGRRGGPSGRLGVDRYISPGLLRATYDGFLLSDKPKDRELIGIQPERVRLQRLLIEEGEAEDAEVRARTLLEQARDRGEDFGDLIRLHGSGREQRETGGLSEPHPVEIFREISQITYQSTALYDFARSGKEGDYLGPLAHQEDGRQAWSVYKLVERLPATTALPFTDPGLQRSLRDVVQSRIDEIRIRAAFETVLGDLYVHPPELREFLRQGGGLLGR